MATALRRDDREHATHRAGDGVHRDPPRFALRAQDGEVELRDHLDRRVLAREREVGELEAQLVLEQLGATKRVVEQRARRRQRELVLALSAPRRVEPVQFAAWPVCLPAPAFAMSCRNCVFRPARPTMKRRMPAVYAFFADVIDGPRFALVLPQLFGSPSVASRMTGGEPIGGGFAAKSATVLSIAGAVGVVPPFGTFVVVSVCIAIALLSARGAVKPLRLRHGD